MGSSQVRSPLPAPGVVPAPVVDPCVDPCVDAVADVDLARLVTAVVDRVVLAEQRAVEVWVPSGPVWVTGDTLLLDSIVDRLLTAAVALGPAEDLVHCWLERTPDGAVLEVRARRGVIRRAWGVDPRQRPASAAAAARPAELVGSSR